MIMRMIRINNDWAVFRPTYVLVPATDGFVPWGPLQRSWSPVCGRTLGLSRTSSGPYP
jgi:hypothetical protein